jgi:phosphonate transport system substrate-binding protein
LVATALALAAPGAHANDRPLQVGVLPNLSARTLMAQYQPFRQFLEGELARPVEIITAPGMRAFHERALAGTYHLTVTAANLARIAEADAGLAPVSMYEPRIPGALVTRRDRPLTGLERARGSAVALANPLSLVALTFRLWAIGQGLEPGRDLRLLEARNEDSLAELLATGAARLAVMSRGEFNAIRPAIRDQLEVAEIFATVPGFIALLAPDLDPALARRISNCLALFRDTDLGRQFLAETGFTGLRPITSADLDEVDPVVPETRRLLAA